MISRRWMLGIGSLAVILILLLIFFIQGKPSTPAENKEGSGLNNAQNAKIEAVPGAPVISNIQIPQQPTKAYEKFEVTFQLDGSYTNPYDPDDIDVEAHFTYPVGKEAAVPAFFYTPYESINGKTLLNYNPKLYRSTGPSSWKIRFAAGMTGKYQFYITAKDAEGRLSRTEQKSFQIVSSPSKGFIRISQDNPMYFENSADGSLFYGSGSNIAWVRSNDTKDPAKLSYEYFMGKAAGSTSMTRVWLCHWAWLEWTRDPNKPETFGYDGKLHYNQYIASAMDNVFDLAEKNNLKIILTLDDNNELMDATTYDSWAYHPYNVKNGGPAASVQDYWKNPEVRELYKKRLRYILARWGYSTSLATLNSWNDMTKPGADQVSYLKDLRGYVHEVADDFRPVIYGSNYRFEANKVLDYVYSGKEKDQTKPNVTNETYFTKDTHWFKPVLQKQVWEGLAEGDAVRMVWPHNLVDESGSWAVFKSLLSFVQDLPLNKKPWNPLKVKVDMAVTGQSASSMLRVISLEAYGDVPNFGVKAPENRFAVDADENNQWLEGLGVTLYGSSRKEWRNPPTLTFTPPAGSKGKLLVEVDEVGSGTNTLTVTVNDDLKKSVSWNGGRHVLKEDERFVEVPLDAGENRIILDNAGGDWLRLAKVYFLLDSSDPANLLSAKGLGSGDEAFVYLYNQTYDELYGKLLNGQPLPLQEVSFEIGGLRDGAYDVDIYDPATGRKLREMSASSKNGVMPLQIGSMEMDSAVKVKIR